MIVGSGEIPIAPQCPFEAHAWSDSTFPVILLRPGTHHRQTLRSLRLRFQDNAFRQLITTFGLVGKLSLKPTIWSHATDTGIYFFSAIRIIQKIYLKKKTGLFLKHFYCNVVLQILSPNKTLVVKPWLIKYIKCIQVKGMEWLSALDTTILYFF